MTDEQRPDPKVTIGAFNEAIRAERSRHRVQVGPSMSRDSLNAALRVAAGHEPQHSEEEPEPGSFPWRSLGSRDGDA
jgi:hypothetical protein